MKRPEPSQYYDVHEMTDYMNKKHGFTDKDWDEVIYNFADLLSNGAILTIDAENGNKLEEAIVKEFGENGTGSVDLYYWW